MVQYPEYVLSQHANKKYEGGFLKKSQNFGNPPPYFSITGTTNACRNFSKVAPTKTKIQKNSFLFREGEKTKTKGRRCSRQKIRHQRTVGNTVQTRGFEEIVATRHLLHSMHDLLHSQKKCQMKSHRRNAVLKAFVHSILQE